MLTVASNCGITINPATFVTASLAIPFAQSFSASQAGTYSFSRIAGTLPPGLTITSVLGVYSLRGTPTTAGTYNFTIQASKASSTCVSVRNYTIVIAASVIPIAECITNNGNGTFTARFGYDNSTGAVVTIAVSASNYFSVGAQNRNQPTVFQSNG